MPHRATAPRDPKELMEIKGVRETQQYLVEEVQKVYRDQGVSIHDKHVELIVRQMTRRIGVQEPGDSDFLPGERVDQKVFREMNRALVEEGKRPAEGRPELMGITKASLATDSWLSAASFQETTRVLTEAAIDGRGDNLRRPQGEHHHRQAHPRRYGHAAATASSTTRRPTTSRWRSTRPTRPPTSSRASKATIARRPNTRMSRKCLCPTSPTSRRWPRSPTRPMFAAVADVVEIGGDGDGFSDAVGEG